MWTRKELKDKAKVAFRANYWKAVFVALVIVAISVWASGPSGLTFSVPASSPTPEISNYSPDEVNVDVSNGKITIDVDGDDGGSVHVNLDPENSEEIDELIDDITHDGATVTNSDLFVPGMVLAGLSFGMLMLVIIAIAIALYAFIFNPLEIGCMRFFLRNLGQRAEVKELAFAYDNNYIESVKTLFLRDLFILLWSLLLIIPGIYKSYEYRMIPYLMAEDPTMTKDRAFAESKRMMDGQKWNAFVLDLSFIGWNILSALTLGILGVFYVGPYQAQTNAALYEKLRYGLPAPEQPTQSWQAAPYGTSPYANSAQPAPATQPAQTATIPFDPVAAQPTQPVQTEPVAAAPAEPAQIAVPEPVSPMEAQTETTPVIVPAAQPPIPAFAAVGYEPADEPEEEKEDLSGALDIPNDDEDESSENAD